MKKTKEHKLFYYTMPGIYAKKIIELETCEERTAWLLQKNEHLRNCDKCLLIYYWKHVDNLDNISRENIHAMTSAESITRARRILQNNLGLFLPTDAEVVRSRAINEVAVMEWAFKEREMKHE
jgi:hypothetical protein